MNDAPKRNPDPEVAFADDQMVVTLYDDYFEAKPFWGYCDVYLGRKEAEALIAKMQAALAGATETLPELEGKDG